MNKQNVRINNQDFAVTQSKTWELRCTLAELLAANAVCYFSDKFKIDEYAEPMMAIIVTHPEDENLMVLLYIKQGVFVESKAKVSLDKFEVVPLNVAIDIMLTYDKINVLTRQLWRHYKRLGKDRLTDIRLKLTLKSNIGKGEK